MKIDKQIRQWAQMVNESEDAIIYKNESIGRSDVPGEKHLKDSSDLEGENSDKLFDIGIQALLTTIGEIGDDIKRIPYKFEDDKVRILYEKGEVTKDYKSVFSWIAQNKSKLYRQFHDRFSYHSKKVEDYAAYPQHVTLLKGTYTINGFDGFDITITVKSNDGFMLSLKNFDIFGLEDCDNFSDELTYGIKRARKHGLQYHKPNLPKESEEVEEAQHRDDGSVLVSFTIPTEKGVSQVQFRKSATEFLDWMTKIDEEEKKQDILLDLSQKDETSFELSKPITINIKSL